MGLSRFSKRKSLAALEFWEVVSHFALRNELVARDRIELLHG